MSDWVAYDFIYKIKSRPTDYFRRNKQVPLVFAAIGVMHQKIDELAQYIYESEHINAANGIELDRFGEYSGVSRDGKSDENYRIEILNSVLSASYSGAPWQVMKLAASITQSENVRIVERPFASFTLHLDGEVIPKNIVNLIDKASSSGVKAYVTHDYGTGGFELAGIDTQSGSVLSVGENQAVKIDENVGLGVGKGSVFLGGSMLDSVLSNSDIEGLISVNDNYLEVNDNEYIQVGSGFESNRKKFKSNLCGVMPG